MQITSLHSLLLHYEQRHQEDYSYFLEARTGYPIISNKGWTLAKDYKTSLSASGEKLVFKKKGL